MLPTLLPPPRPRPALVVGLVARRRPCSPSPSLAFGGSADVVVYNGRSQYGDETGLHAVRGATGLDVELRGGTAPELFERLRSEGADTPADLLVTTDLANLWRAEEAGLLEPVAHAALERTCPAERRDPDGEWWGLSLRIRTPMRSTERVPEDAIRSYEDLGDARCQRQALPAHVEQRVQPVARRRHARQARRGGHREAAALLDGQRPADPRLRRRRARGDRGRPLRRRPDEPLLPRRASSRTTRTSRSRPAWPDQDGAGAHANLSGVGLVKGAEHRADADRAHGVPDLAEAPGGRSWPTASSRPTRTSRRPRTSPTGRDVKLDPIDVERRRPPAARRRRADAAGRVAVAARRAAAPRPPAPAAGPGGRSSASLVALLVAGPLVALPLSFSASGEAFDQIAAACCPRRCATSVVLAAGVGAGTLLLGGGLAALVSFYDFPGRRWLDWALVLPLAMPAYVLVFVLLGQYDAASPLQSGLRAVFGDGFRLPEIRSTAGAIAVLTRVLYPYVYVLGRSAFLEQSRDTIEAARTLGLSHGRGDPARRAAARPPRAGRRRGAGDDGGARRLRRRQPPQLPRDDRRDLPRLVRRVRPARRRSSSPPCWSASTLSLRRARAAAARPRPLPRRARARRGGRAAPAARARGACAAAAVPVAARCSWSSARRVAQLVAWSVEVARRRHARPGPRRARR